MKIFNFNNISSQDKFKLLTSSVVPRPIAWISSKDSNGVYNIAPFSYFNLVSTEPPLISVSIRRDGGVTKDTANNIFTTKEFVVHIVDVDNLEMANKSSYEYRSMVSEIDELGLTRVKSKFVGTDGVKEAKIRLECVYEKHLNLETADLFIGRVVGMQVDDDVVDNEKIDLQILEPASRLGGPNYGLVGEVIPLEKPKK
ncbi:MAG: flavin reductase family protein [Bacilli bacterium]